MVDDQAVQGHENDVQSHPSGVIHLWNTPRAFHRIAINLRHPGRAKYGKRPEENHVDVLEENDLEEGQEVNAELHVLRPAQLSLIFSWEPFDGEDSQMGQHDPMRGEEEDYKLQDHR